MANGLMAVMNVETAGSFKAHQIMGKPLKNVNSITKDDFWFYRKDKLGKIVSKKSRVVGETFWKRVLRLESKKNFIKYYLYFKN